MLKNLTVGQYIYKKTIIHQLDPRIKILSVIVISILLSVIQSYADIVLLSSCIVVIVVLSRIRFVNIIKSLASFWFFFIFIFLMYALFSTDKLGEGLTTIWRFVLLITIASVLTFSTSMSDLIRAIESLLTPLRMIHIKSRDVALMIAITFRFIPLLSVEANKVRDAKLSRLADLKKIKNVELVIIPLLKKVCNAASNLSDALIARCYRNEGTTHMKQLTLGYRDYVAVMFLVILGVILWI